MLCFYGCGQVATYELKCGRGCCSEFATQCPAMRKKNSEALKARIASGNFQSNFFRSDGTHVRTGRAAPNKGKPCSEEQKVKISDALKGKSTVASFTPEQKAHWRQQISDGLRRVEAGGYRRGSGRGKKGWYQGFWCDSSWELAWVLFHLDLGIPFARNQDRFRYLFDGVWSSYTPDFKMTDGSYVEVKGYLSPRVAAKVASVPGKIVVMGQDEMTPILRYAVEKFGKDFVKLYDHGSDPAG